MTATCATVASALLDAAVAAGLGPALEYAIEIANRERLPVLVAFGLMEAAFGTILHLNNKYYFVDGHDPNSCANAWIFGVQTSLAGTAGVRQGALHDRAGTRAQVRHGGLCACGR